MDTYTDEVSEFLIIINFITLNYFVDVIYLVKEMFKLNFKTILYKCIC